MDVTRSEFAAVGGVECDVLDAQGRLIVTPHPVTVDGQTNVPADLRPGESLDAFLTRHVPGIASGAWAVSIGGRTVPQHMWARTYPKHGNVIACRCVVRKAALQLIAVAALAFFAPQVALGMGLSGFAASAVTAGVTMAGSMLINKVLGPKVPKPSESGPGRSVYSLSGQRNTARPYEPLPVLWGEMRVTPDLASMPYTWSEGDDQYLSTILLGGINVHRVADLSVGDTPLSSFEGVEVYHSGYSGMPSVPVPLYSNADTIAGAELVKSGPWVTRTGSVGTIAMQVDIEGQLYDVDSKGKFHPNTVPLFIETRPVGGAGIWSTQVNETLTHAETALMRRTFTFSVSAGQYEVRVRIGAPRWDEGEGKDACKLAWTVLKSIQPDTTDYSQWGRSAIKIKASGQISGSFDTVRMTATARPHPVWNGLTWVDGTLRANGLSNPGAIILQTLRGVYANGILQFGFGMQDAQIDIEGLKAFMLHCTAKGYTYDRWITSSMSLQAFCDEVALAGMGQFTWTDGSRPTVSFVGSGQPLGGVVNMANMLKGSFSVAYNLANAADGIEYQYLDRERNWETQTLRVMAPGVTTMLNPARITGEGVTSEAQAAVLARYHLAQSLYQYKTIDFTADIEHLDYRRLSVLSVSHDLTQWGFGGRVVSAATVAGKVVLTLDEEVPNLPTRFVGLRVPGARDYTVFGVEAFTGKTNTITLVGAWPAGVAFPGATLDNPAHDTLWCYDFKATPGYRVRVVAMEPEADLKGARVTCVPEGPEFWGYVLNGTYVPAPNQSSLPLAGRPVVSNLRVSEQVHLQGDTEWFELHAVWDVAGDYDHAQVWAGMDGSELRLVDGNAVSTRSSFRIETAGEWLIEVRPFNSGGLVGQSAAVLYITSRTNIAPRNVDQFVVQVVEGGLRRFAWQYTGDRPPALAGVQIRYLSGDVPLSEAGWDAMTPLGKPDDVYSAQFESTRPAAGQWTFGIRAINTSGLLSPGVLRFAINLPASLPGTQAPDLTPPPKPTGVTATALMSTAQVNWNAPTYTVGRGHDHSIISAAVVVTGQPVPAFAAAVKVGTPEGQPASIPVELGGTKYRLWVQHVSKEGVASVPSDPVDITTSVDPVKILEILTGQIGTSQLHTSLSTPIGLITAPAGTVGSVNARIEAQRTALQSNIDAVQAQLAEVTGAAEYVAGTTYAVGKLAKYQGKLYRAKATTTGNLPTNATYWELVGEYASIGEAVAAHAVQLSDQLTRIQNVEGGLVTEASNRNTLAVQMRGNYTGTDPDALVAGLAWNERKARVTADAANTNLIQGVRNDLIAEQGRINGHATAITGLTTDVSNINGRIGTEASRIDAVTANLSTTNSNVTAAQNAANNAATAAGSKGEVIYGTTQPTVAQRLAQNLWIDTNGNANTPKRWNGSGWAAVTDKVATDAAAAAAAANSALAGKADASALSALTTRVATEEGKSTSLSDSLTSLNNTISNPTTGLAAAQTAAQNAAALAGSKGEVIYGTAQPTTAQRLPQNLWIDTANNANTPKRWNGGAWVAVTDKVATDAAAAAANAVAGLASKADSSVVSALSGTVTQQGNTLTSQGNSLLALTNSVNDPTAGLSATATNATQALSKATSADGKADAQASQITTLQARIDSAKGVFSEAWTTPAPLDAWEVVAGAGERSIVASSGTAGGKALSLGNNSGNDMVAFAHRSLIAVEATRTYRMTVRVRRTFGAGTLYLGWLGIAANGNTRVSIAGVNAPDNAHYHTANNAAPGAAWVTYVGYTQGFGASAGTGAAGTKVAPGKLHPAAVFMRPLIVANSPAAAGTFEIDTIQVDDVTDLQELSAAIETEASVRANTDNGLLAQYTVKVDTNGHVSGFGLANTVNNGVPSSSFIIKSDRFAISAPGVTAIVPFVVQATAQTINGVSVPAGVYMDSAYITNVTALWGRFGTLVADKIQATALSASQLTAGNGVIGGTLKSSNYTAGGLGWQLLPGGAAEFGQIVARGTIYATSGSIGGNTITSDAIMSPSVTSYSAGNGFYLGAADGKVRFGNATGARLQWTGTAVEIYNAAGQLTLSSGGVDWSAVAGRPTSLAGLNAGEANKLAGIAAGATVGAVAGTNIYDAQGILINQNRLTSNLIDASTWVVNTFGAQPGFAVNPTSFGGSNSTQYDALPDGSSGVVWVARSGNSNGTSAEGGWYGDAVAIDSLKMYRFSVWVKTTGNVATGSYALGLGENSVRNLGGGTNANPFFFTGSRNLLVANRWYLVTGYVYPSAYAGNLNMGAVFDGYTGKQVGASTSFRWQVGESYTRHRAYQFNTASTDSYTLFWNPRIELCDGTEEGIDALLSATSVTGKNPISAVNISTYMANAAIGRAQMGYAAIGFAEIEQASIKALSIGLDEITVPTGTTGYGAPASTVVTLTQPGKIIVMVTANWLAPGGGDSTGSITATCGVLSGSTVGVSMGGGQSGSAAAIGIFSAGAGVYTCSATLSNTGVRNIGATGIVAFGAKR